METSKIQSQDIGKVGKIIIPKNIENYINILHKEVGATEWSGILFYKLTKGNIEKFKDLEFTIDFIYPMDIGNSSYTEFDYNENVMNAYDIREDLIESSNSLIHSHHNMNAFFSGTDTSELLNNAKNFNYYISLIVNFNKSYACKIAFPSKSVVNKKYTVKDQNGKLITYTSKQEVDEVLVGDLIIDFEDKPVEEEWLTTRIATLKNTKIPTIRTLGQGKVYPSTYAPYNDYGDYDGYPYGGNYSSNTVKAKGTALQFLVSLLNLDVTKKNSTLYSTLTTLKKLETFELEMFSDAISLNVDIIYSQIFPDDAMLANLEDTCLEALTELNKYKAFKDEEFIEIIKDNLKTYVIQ